MYLILSLYCPYNCPYIILFEIIIIRKKVQVLLLSKKSLHPNNHIFDILYYIFITYEIVSIINIHSIIKQNYAGSKKIMQ